MPDYIYAESQGNFTGRGGLSTFPSQSIAVYNGYGVQIATISRSTPFDFNGASFTGWFNTDLPSATSITMNGYQGSTLVGSVTYSLSTDFQWCDAQFAQVDSVQLVSSASGNWWLMDNFTYNQSVPEPTGSVLLLLGGVAVIGFRPRKRAGGRN